MANPRHHHFVTMWLDDRGVERRLLAHGSSNDPVSPRYVTVTIDGLDEDLDGSDPSPSEVTELGDLSAADVLPSFSEFVPACAQGLGPIDGRPTTLEQELNAAEGLTFGEYVQERYPVRGE